MTEEISELRAQLDQMQDRLAELEGGTPDAPRMSRRRALTALGAAAAGATAATVSGIGFASPAGATDGSNVVIGNETQTAQSSTALIAGGSYAGSNALGGFSVTDNPSPASNASATLTCLAGIATGTNFTVGLLGASSASGGVGAKLDGATPLKLSDSSNAGVPSGSSGTAGQFRYAGGQLYFCVDDSSATDKWRRITGPTVAGAYVAVDPFRAYDSRWGAGPIGTSQSRVIAIQDAHNGTGGVTTANVVPAGARAVTFNLTVANTASGGYLSLVPGSSSDFSTSTINWAGNGLALANGSTVKLNTTRQVKVFCGSGSTDFIIDITGYYF